MISTHEKLLINATSTGSLKFWPGGIAVFTAVASAWNGATITLQYQEVISGTLVNAGSTTTLTANGNGVAYLPACWVQATVSGGTPTAAFANLSRVAE